MILVPVKNLANAKQRLSSVLDPEARQELAQAMCADVLDVLERWQGRPSVTVVTSDPFAGNLATRFGFDVVADEANPGETGANEMATVLCRDRGEGFTLGIPADIPFVESFCLQKNVESGPQRAS